MKKKLKVIDLFCGCGGLSKGFELAGFEIVGGIDFNKDAINTFNKNFPKANGIYGDILDFDNKKIKKEFENINKIDIVIGGPPCQGFSSANRYKKEKDDPRNKLFFQFVKFVDLAKPKAILIENVRGIVTKDGGYAKNRIIEIFTKRGYTVNHKILNAADYGVPQNRYRNFFVMIKNNVQFDFDVIEKTKKKTTVKEAICELYKYESNEYGAIKIKRQPKTNFQKYLRANNNVAYNHDVRYPADFVQKRISYVQQGGNWVDVPEKLFPNKRKNRHSSAYKRLEEDKQSCTIDTGNNHSNYFHPLYNRIPTVREAARLQSFPDDFIFTGNRSEQYRQVGNAVPPLLAKAIAREIKEVINNE